MQLAYPLYLIACVGLYEAYNSQKIRICMYIYPCSESKCSVRNVYYMICYTKRRVLQWLT